MDNQLFYKYFTVQRVLFKDSTVKLATNGFGLCEVGDIENLLLSKSTKDK